MLRAALRTLPRPVLRTYASAAASRPPLTAHAVLERGRAGCADPALALVAALHSPGGEGAVDDACRDSGIPTDEYASWLPVASAPSMAAALDRAQDTLAAIHAGAQPSQPARLPAWVLLAIMAKESASPTEAFAAQRLALAHPLRLSPELGPLVLILVAYWLARLRMYAPLHVVVLRLARSPKYFQAHHISLLLRILARAEPDRELQPLLAALLPLAIRRKAEISQRTYRLILDSPAVSVQVAKLVQAHMDALHFHPNLAHSRAFLKVFAKAGDRKRAAMYWRRIRAGEFSDQVPEYIVEEPFRTRTLGEYMKAFRDTRAVGAYVKYLLKTTARAGEEDHGRRFGLQLKPTLPDADGIPLDVWLQVLGAASRDRRITTGRLLALYDEGAAAISCAATRLHAATMVIKSLLRRQAFSEIPPLLRDVLQHKGRFNVAQLSIAAEALTMLGRPVVAFRLLREFLPHLPAPDGDGAPNSGARADEERKPTVDIQAVNTFMIALVRTGRPDAVFCVWDALPALFPGVEPNAATLAVVFKAARFARKCEGAVQVALEDFGLRRLFPHRPPASASGEGDAAEGLVRMLESGRAVTGFWRGERAGKVALRVAWEVFVGNWPALAGVEPPVRARRRGADHQALSPVAELYQSVHPPRNPRGSGAGFDADAGEEPEGGKRTYYGVVPHDVMFRALLDVLAAEEHAGEVPRVLAWMRYLGVRPSKETVATAFVYWAEVSLEGPLIERWKGEGQSEYARLWEWTKKWLGEKAMPGREETQRALERVRWFREMGALGRGGADVAQEMEVDL